MNARTQFLTDAAAAREAEELVAAVMASLTSTWNFEVIEGEDENQHKGDIRVTDPVTGFSLFLEVKDDSRIATTGNVLCEVTKFFADTNTFKPGNMSYDYEYYCVISQESRTIYVIDFSILKQVYRQGVATTIYHEHDTTYCYLVPLELIVEKGGLIRTIAY